ncbi:MAG: type 4a pilus biogenesis protein PilO [Bdellovibrionales bacterium]
MINDILARLTVVRAMVLGMALAAFYYFMVFDPGVAQQAQIAATNSKIQDLQAQITGNQKKLDRAAVYKKTAAEIGSTITKLLSLVPEKFGMPDLMRIISNEAKGANLSLAAMSPQPSVVSHIAAEFEELSVDVELSGNFLQHMVFLSNLTRINQILITRKIEFSYQKDGKGDESPTVGMKTLIVAYRYRGGQKDTPKPKGKGK